MKFNKGYKILHEIEPFVHVIYSNWKIKRCNYCFKFSKLKKCSKCNFMFYCSVVCQKLDWNPCHKIECKSKLHMYLIDFEKCVDVINKPKYETALIQLCFRILIKLKLNLITDQIKKIFFTNKINSPSRVIQLAAIWTKLSSSSYIKKYFVNYSNKFYLVYSNLEKYRIQICENNLLITGLTPEQVILGEGLFIELCSFPHSCKSNTSFSFDNIKLTLSLIEDSISLSQVNVNYLNIVGLPESICIPYNIRKNLILLRNLKCNCILCKLPDYWQDKNYENIMIALFTLRKDLYKNTSVNISAITYLIKYLRQNFHYSNTIISLLLFRLAYFYTISNKWEETVKILDELCIEIKFTHSTNQIKKFLKKYTLFRKSLINKSLFEIQFLSDDFYKITKNYC